MILEEGNRPHFNLFVCDIFIHWVAINRSHSTNAFCVWGAERKQRQLADSFQGVRYHSGNLGGSSSKRKMSFCQSSETSIRHDGAGPIFQGYWGGRAHMTGRQANSIWTYWRPFFFLAQRPWWWPLALGGYWGNYITEYHNVSHVGNHGDGLIGAGPFPWWRRPCWQQTWRIWRLTSPGIRTRKPKYIATRLILYLCL